MLHPAPGNYHWPEPRSEPIIRSIMNRPDTVCVELTVRCPLRCVHCSASAGPERIEALDASLLVARLQELAPVAAIYLSGGEPFEHPRFAEVAAAASQLAQEVTAYSSGVKFSDNRISALSSLAFAEVGRWLTRIDFSVYAMSADEHDSVTRTPGSFDCVLESISIARSLGIPFGIHFVPVLSGKHLMQVAQFARYAHASRFHVLGLIRQGRAASLVPTYDDAFLSKLRLLSTMNLGFDIVISSTLRKLIGMGTTSRDSMKPAFIDVHGNVYPGEGLRTASRRSLRTIADAKIAELLA